MGADLYIRKISGNNYSDNTKPKAWDSKDGYFRDSYNGTNILWTLGFSWWQDVTKLLNKNGELEGEKLIQFRDMVINAKQDTSFAYLTKAHLTIDDNKNSIEVWQKYFKDGRQELIDFLNRAIDLKTSIDCSL